MLRKVCSTNFLYCISTLSVADVKTSCDFDSIWWIGVAWVGKKTDSEKESVMYQHIFEVLKDMLSH